MTTLECLKAKAEKKALKVLIIEAELPARVEKTPTIQTNKPTLGPWK